MTEINELDILKQRATTMGLSFHPNIGIESLKNKINAHLASDGKSAGEGNDEPEQTEDKDEGDELVTDTTLTSSNPPATASATKVKQTPMQKRLAHIAEMTKLVRLRISNLNPAKKAWPGEIISCGNSRTGIIRKFVPFGEASEEGYHVPHFVYLTMKDRKFNSIKTRKGPNGKTIIDQRLVPEFALEVLEPLTPDELAKLAAKQAAAHSID
jgi:hypothetical protein